MKTTLSQNNQGKGRGRYDFSRLRRSDHYTTGENSPLSKSSMTSLIGLLFFLGLLSSMGLELDCLHLSLGLNILFGCLSAIASFCNLLGMLSTSPLLKSSCFFLQQHIQNPVKCIQKTSNHLRCRLIIRFAAYPQSPNWPQLPYKNMEECQRQ